MSFKILVENIIKKEGYILILNKDERICAFEKCKRKFIGQRLYCSDLCKKSANGKIDINNVHSCLNCDKTFYSKSKKDFCTVACKNEYKKKNTFYKKVCKQCNKEFEAHSKEQDYCSDECIKGSQLFTVKCKQCNNDFKAFSNSTKFCSEECEQQFIQEKREKYGYKHPEDYSGKGMIPIVSEGEKKLYKLLQEIFTDEEIIYRERYNFLRNPETNSPLELDFYIPSLNLAFEYDGQFHDQFTKSIHGEIENFIKQQQRDKFKDEKCKKNDITLIRFKIGKDFVNIETLIKKLKEYCRTDIVELIKERKGDII